MLMLCWRYGFYEDYFAQRTYIQVSYDITEPKTFEREVAPLLKITDGYSKMIIARTYQPEYHYEGIKIIDAAEWLLSENDGESL
ncbi:hypothetical protein SAMN02910456_02273 [Ruminococcaceae bacterium YRB3002]|nr:hypothetical protein SAMN02910456_02273 [Ruminococcaceae bacterium YRB3002]